MHFNIYIDDSTGLQLTSLAKKRGKTRNHLIREAIQTWVKQQISPQWPEEVIAFKGIPKFPAFESHRKKLTPPKEDPLA